jgi:DNA-directed RNA polymerase beta' subunit
MKKFVKKLIKIDNDIKKIEIKSKEDKIIEEKKILKPIIQLKTDININEIQINNTSNSEPQLRKVTGIDITFMSASEIENMSFVQMTHSKLSGDNSIYDPRMGPIKNYENCVVCGLTWSQCPGHTSYIKLNSVIPHPIMMRRISDFLTCFCGNTQCNRLIMKKSEIKVLDVLKYKGENRFMAFLQVAKKAIKCSHCNSPHGKYTIKDDKFIKLFKIRSSISKLIISYEDVADIIKNIRQQDLNVIGITNPLCHPEHMLMKNMLGLPSSSRPFVESNNNVCHDDLSYKYIEIIKINNRLSQKLDEKQYYDSVDALMFHIKTFIDNSKNKARDPGGKRSLKALKQRLTGKTGLIRQNIQGKRTGLCIRSVISPDPHLHVNEVGIPREVAEVTAYPMRVNRFNMDQSYNLLNSDKVLNIKRGNFYIDAKRATNHKGYVLKYNDIIVRNNQKLYPMYIIRNSKYVKTLSRIGDRIEEYKIQEGDSVITSDYKMEDGVYTRKTVKINNVKPGSKKPFKLMEGDIIERKLQDGDWVMFNRQPTLHEASMRAKRVKIHNDKTLKMELSSTQGYNADQL